MCELYYCREAWVGEFRANYDTIDEKEKEMKEIEEKIRTTEKRSDLRDWGRLAIAWSPTLGPDQENVLLLLELYSFKSTTRLFPRDLSSHLFGFHPRNECPPKLKKIYPRIAKSSDR
jgi:hypothetical protein